MRHCASRLGYTMLLWSLGGGWLLQTCQAALWQLEGPAGPTSTNLANSCCCCILSSQLLHGEAQSSKRATCRQHQARRVPQHYLRAGAEAPKASPTIAVAYRQLQAGPIGGQST